MSDTEYQESLHFITSHPEAVAREMTKRAVLIEALRAENERLKAQDAEWLDVGTDAHGVITRMKAENEKLRAALDAVRASGLLIGSTTLHDRVRAVVNDVLTDMEKQEIDVTEWDKTRWD